MKITAIEKQRKDGRYNIFLDGEFAFGLYKESIFDFGLRVNDEIDEKKAAEIREYDEAGFGKKIAYSFLNYKTRSEKEVRKKLKEKKISEKSIEKIIESLKSLKFVNDGLFAKMYVESKLLHKPQGRRLISNKLKEKGIDKETAEQTIQEHYTEETEIKKAKDLLRKFEKKVRAKSPSDKKQKCYRHLMSKGFDFDIINKAMKLEDSEQ